MSKVYLITDADIYQLLTLIDRNPRHGESGGSSQVLSKEEEEAFNKAHRFYNYQVRSWLDDTVKRG